MNKPYRLLVTKKTGYRNINGNPIVIFDKRGLKFYDTRELENKVWAFNLPKGEYYVHAGKFSETAEPVVYDMLPLPQPERTKNGRPEHFDIFFADNPYGATIYWDKRAMLFDNRFKELTLPELIVVYYHECGHKYWDSEDVCDRYAYNKMIEAGYNPSQIMSSFVNTLSDRQLIRKNLLVDSVLEKNVNHYDYDSENFLETQSADYYIGSVLSLKKTSSPIGIWSNPTLNSTLLKTLYAGQTVGTIYSYVVDNEGKLWWQLAGGGFVQHRENVFDRNTVEKTASGKVHSETLAKQEELSKDKPDLITGVTSIFSGVGNNLGIILIIGALIYFAPLIKNIIKK